MATLGRGKIDRRKARPLDDSQGIRAQQVNLSVIPAVAQPVTTVEVQPALGAPIMREDFITTTGFSLTKTVLG